MAVTVVNYDADDSGPQPSEAQSRSRARCWCLFAAHRSRGPVRRPGRERHDGRQGRSRASPGNHSGEGMANTGCLRTSNPQAGAYDRAVRTQSPSARLNRATRMRPPVTSLAAPAALATRRACEDGRQGAAALGFPCTVLASGEAPVTRGSGDQSGARTAALGRLRASHADREHVIGVLKVGFVQGLLTKDEFDARVAQTFTSRTYAELAAVTADIPTGLIGAQPPRRHARGRARPPVNIPVIIATTVLTAGLWAVASVTNFDNGALFVLVFSFSFAWLGFLIISGVVLLESRHGGTSNGPVSRSRVLAAAGSRSGDYCPGTAADGEPWGVRCGGRPGPPRVRWKVIQQAMSTAVATPAIRRQGLAGPAGPAGRRSGSRPPLMTSAAGSSGTMPTYPRGAWRACSAITG